MKLAKTSRVIRIQIRGVGHYLACAVNENGNRHVLHRSSDVYLTGMEQHIKEASCDELFIKRMKTRPVMLQMICSINIKNVILHIYQGNK